MAIATLDLSLFQHNQSEQRNAFALDLKRELTRHGFVKIVGHGVSDADIAKAFGWNKKLFGLKPAQKAAFAHPGGSAPQRGWSAVGAENAAALFRKGILHSNSTDILKDAREHFDQGSKKDLEFPNRWPDPNTLPGFREFMEMWYEQLQDVAARLMEALEVAFGLPPGSFLDKMTKEASASEARLLHYPTIDIQEISKGTTSRIWPHFDLGVITLLFQDSVGGLECEDRSRADTFIPIESCSPSEMIVNVSETLQRWTNDALPAGLHRVTVPSQFQHLEAGLVPERYSLTYFCKADRRASASPLPHYVSQNTPAKYDEMTAIEYHRTRLQSAY